MVFTVWIGINHFVIYFFYDKYGILHTLFLRVGLH